MVSTLLGCQWRLGDHRGHHDTRAPIDATGIACRPVWRHSGRVGHGRARPSRHCRLARLRRRPTQLDDLLVDVDDLTVLLAYREQRHPAMRQPDVTAPARWSALGAWFDAWAQNARGEVWIDAGTGAPPPDLAACVEHRWLITRPCYLSLRQAARDAARPTGVVLVDEPGRALRARDVERATGAPIVTRVLVDTRPPPQWHWNHDGRSPCDLGASPAQRDHGGQRQRASAVAWAAMDLRTTASTVGGIPTVAVDGVVDLASIAVFRDALLRTIHSNSGELIVADLDGVAALDDAGLGVLLGAAAAARQADGDLEIVCNGERLRTRLERTRLDQAIAVRTSIA